MIGSGDDVDRTALNPNRVDQPLDEIGGGLTKAQIIERLRGLDRYGQSFRGWDYSGMSHADDGDYCLRDDILAIIKDA